MSDTSRLVESDSKGLRTKSTGVVDGTAGGWTWTWRSTSSSTDTDETRAWRSRRTLLLRRRSVEDRSGSGAGRHDRACSRSSSFPLSPFSREGLVILRKDFVGNMGSRLGWSLHHSRRR
jgi:hypothetical protein